MRIRRRQPARDDRLAFHELSPNLHRGAAVDQQLESSPELQRRLNFADLGGPESPVQQQRDGGNTPEVKRLRFGM